MKLNDRIEGAVYGALIAGVLGQVPPFTALPEEVVSMPLGAAVGALIGARGIRRAIPRL